MTLTKGLLASIAEVTSDPGQILREVNRHLYVACGKKMFVTLLLGVLDPVSRTFSYARAGHNPPVWRQPASQLTSLLHARGLGLGLNSGDVFDRTLLVETIQLRSEDKILLYSDGITEAMNDQRLEYGEERLMEAAERADRLDARATRDAILDDVTAFLGKTLPQDDQTLVVVQVN
jgi:serine phosphatase RsbU (regulator of sigma subunit)